MPVLNPPADPSKILVEVPLPQPVVSQPRQPAPQPVQQQPAQPQPEPDPFRQIKGPPVMILPHVAIQGKEKMSRRGKPVRMSASIDEHIAFHNAIASEIKRGKFSTHTPSLVYADFLEENGYPHIAEHIRKAVADGLVRIEKWVGRGDPRSTWNRKLFGVGPDANGGKQVNFAFKVGKNKGHVVYSQDHPELEEVRKGKPQNPWDDGWDWDEFYRDREKALKPLIDESESIGRYKDAKRKLSRFRSPAGGMVVRGMFYPGGKMLPKEATEAHPKPNTKANGKKKKKRKKVKPVDTFLPELEPYEMRAKKMSRKGKPTKMSREAEQVVDHLAPIVQQDPNNEGARGILADALEESNRHHDPKTLDHLRSTQYPVYGMIHPASGKWVFSPRRSWLIEQFARANMRRRDELVQFKATNRNHQQLSDFLHSIGLHAHADAFDSHPESNSRSGYWTGSFRDRLNFSSVGRNVSETLTPNGSLAIYRNDYTFADIADRIRQEQSALAEEDRLHG